MTSFFLIIYENVKERISSSIPELEPLPEDVDLFLMFFITIRHFFPFHNSVFYQPLEFFLWWTAI
jgi:hypothetical protein